MKKEKSKGQYFIILGVLLILVALGLTIFNIREENQGGNYSKSTVKQLSEQIPIPDEDDLLLNDKEESFELEEDSFIELDSKKYIGIISIPKIDLELPVMSDWNYSDLLLSPCKYSGTIEEKNLIIAAHNYSSFFKKIEELNSGDEIVFTQCNGTKHIYEVISSELVSGNDISTMTSNSENWDLTLFTCTWSGWSRITIRAVEK